MKSMQSQKKYIKCMLISHNQLIHHFNQNNTVSLKCWTYLRKIITMKNHSPKILLYNTLWMEIHMNLNIHQMENL